MSGEANEGALPLQESGLILSGPDDSIFDDIFDWIANAIAVITSTLIDWISEWVLPFFGNIIEWITWLWGEVSAWFTATWETFTSWIDWLWGEISAWFTTTWETFTDWITWLRNEISADFTGLPDKIKEIVLTPMAAWWDQFLESVFDFGAWVGKLLDAVWGWLSEDVPGSSPRWTAIFDEIGGWFYKWFFEFPKWMFENFPEKVAYGISESLKWVGEIFNETFETFMEAIMGMVRQIGPTNPSIAVNSYSAMAKVGMVALGGLAGMTIAGETLNPISHLGLGHISAMIYDMTNYKVITGVFMGALTFAMLRQPLTYYFNDIFRPYILRLGDFMEPMARDAWSHPELLREPTLVTSVQELTQGKGTAFEQKMIGYYGYPAQYYGLFKELSFAPLRYFPLAGIARVGFWDEPWFTEALSRSGYSPTAREALMVMFREQVLTARQLPVMYQVKRLSREGFATMEEISAHLEKAAKFETLTESRLFAMELEQEFSQKEMAFDIIMRSFSRGIILEDETRKGLAGLGIPPGMLDLHLMREKLGLLRRISIPAEAAAPPPDRRRGVISPW